jgi:serine/threonine protein kinase/Tol biopolymer transport system component
VTIASGTRLGPYEILSAIGAGGMGEVYKATDTRLDRTVAIKVLPEHVAADLDLKQRFEREAKTLAALSHPHICPVFDVGSQNGIDFLVMEYLEGDTLEQRLKKGALPLDQALQTGIQIADALAAAHRAGIVHRDLKPGNVMLTKSGAKLLDFGLAKTGAPAVAGSLSMLPTTPPNLTAQGSILGTFQYMAPEQLEGQEADARTDIFAFGVVLYEMVTAKKAFEGKSQASLIAAILGAEPPTITTFVPAAPIELDRLVKACLIKESADRWQTAQDLVRELHWIRGTAGRARTSGTENGPFWRREWVLASAAIIAAVAFMGALVPAIAHWREPPTQESEMRFEVLTEPRFDDTVVISPDGRLLAFDGLADGKWQLWIRPLDSITARPIPGTDGAVYPFWSPDSGSLAFFAEGKLKRISISGGPAQTLASAPEPRGGTWGSDNTIVFAPVISGPLYRVPASGGDTASATRLQAGQVSHRFPYLLPDGRHVLYFTQSRGVADAMYVSALDGSLDKRLFDAASGAVYARPGILLFRRQQALVAQRFDPRQLSIVGDAFPVADVAGSGPNAGSIAASSSNSGTVVFRARTEQGGGRQLIWFDRSGRNLGVVGGTSLGPINVPDLSPAGDRVALHTTMNGNVDVWVIDVARGFRSRLTTDVQADQSPVWSPDGNQIIFSSARGGSFDLYRTSSLGDGSEELLLENPGTTTPTSWSSDGRSLLYSQLNPETGFDLYVLPLVGDRKPVVFANRPYDEENGQFSKDMRWIAYESNESGQFEVFVQSYPGPRGKWQISTDGGRSPRWREDGRELYYVTADGSLMGVPIRVSADGTEIESSSPVPLLRGQLRVTPRTTASRGNYAAASDGQRFLMTVPLAEAPTPITVILNWAAAFDGDAARRLAE